MPTADEIVDQILAPPPDAPAEPAPSTTPEETVDQAVQEDPATPALASAESAVIRHVQRAASYIDRGRDWIAQQPTPGGVGVLLLILIVLGFVLIPVSADGRTRIALLWSMLTGRAKLLGRRQIEPPQIEEVDNGNSGGGGQPWTEAPTVKATSTGGSTAVSYNPYGDTDNDGIINSLDPDDDNDGIPDSLDPDDDNDGILDINDPDSLDFQQLLENGW